MSFAPALLVSAVMASQAQLCFLSENSHAACLASVAAFTPMAGFNEVVETTRFVGYFLPAADACKVTVFEAAADDEALASPPRRIDLTIPANGRSELDAGGGSALAIACASDADEITIAPQIRASAKAPAANEAIR